MLRKNTTMKSILLLYNFIELHCSVEIALQHDGVSMVTRKHFKQTILAFSTCVTFIVRGIKNINDTS